MNIIVGYPPNIEKIRAKVTINNHTIFTYGDTIYNPGNWDLTPDLKVHEGTHEIQQAPDPEAWWDRYLADTKFRLDQEVEAYRNQWRMISSFCNREQKRFLLNRIASDLASKMYGNIISKSEAMRRITE